MVMLKELLFTDVGLLSLLSILFMVAMSIWLYVWMEKKMKEDAQNHEKAQRAAIKSK